ncbi:MAG: sulfide/dihydroorotate dehydrogenase-like FAD/NAD-binding protein [Candidatus Omnitrophota bacterium]|nr:sulfide/dihydroorotate dehydrogenase-like FAD/NAD-binding protein [Candidatus Omnitrophota bacterium]
MFEIIQKQILAKGIKKLVVMAPRVAKKALAGQFVMVMPKEKGERIPLTIADSSSQNGTITLIFQEVGFSTKKLGQLKVGQNVSSILGPLGKPTEVAKLGTVVCIGGGVGIAEVYPVSCAFKNAGNEVIGIIGARNKQLIILEKEMKEICNQLYVATDDGSYGQKGFVTDALKKLLEAKKHIDLVYAIGPVKMMHAVSELTRPFRIKTLVSLNPIMVDATGMCGSCRVTVAGKTYFGCVDGPEFDAHLVDFKELEARLNLFKEQEKCLLPKCPRRQSQSA